MSLINDALKRAKQAQQRHSPPPATSSPLRPLEVARPTPSSRGLFLPVVVGALILLGGGLLMWFALASSGSKTAALPTNVKATAAAPLPAPVKFDHGPLIQKNTEPVASEATPTSIVSLPVTKPAPAPTASQPVPPPEVLPAAVTSPEAPQTIAPAIAPATNAATVSAEPPPPALPKLQGIFYRPDRPSALLNGKTILVGGRSGDFLVVAITQQSVTLVRAGQTNVLSLPD